MADIIATNARATVVLDIESDGKTIHDLVVIGEDITIVPGPNGEAQVSMKIKVPEGIKEM